MFAITSSKNTSIKVHDICWCWWMWKSFWGKVTSTFLRSDVAEIVEIAELDLPWIILPAWHTAFGSYPHETCRCCVWQKLAMSTLYYNKAPYKFSLTCSFVKENLPVCTGLNSPSPPISAFLTTLQYNKTHVIPTQMDGKTDPRNSSWKYFFIPVSEINRYMARMSAWGDMRMMRGMMPALLQLPIV